MAKNFNIFSRNFSYFWASYSQKMGVASLATKSALTGLGPNEKDGLLGGPVQQLVILKCLSNIAFKGGGPGSEISGA